MALLHLVGVVVGAVPRGLDAFHRFGATAGTLILSSGSVGSRSMTFASVVPSSAAMRRMAAASAALSSRYDVPR